MVFLLATYYESIVALICYYLVQSFRSPLPWANCRPEWGTHCFDSAGISNTDEQLNTSTTPTSASNKAYLKYVEKASNETIMTSSELYFM